MEELIKITNNYLISLFVQELLDSDINGTNKGCGGGRGDEAFLFIKQDQGISSEADYLYEGVEGTCNKKINHVANINWCEYVPPDDKSVLLKAIANQPVCANIDIDGPMFMDYLGDIFKGPCGTKGGHAITIVGYGVDENGIKYWLVKKSGGTKWVEGGYVWMLRDIDKKEGLCSIATHPCYPTN